jgi:hypothetical protein
VLVTRYDGFLSQTKRVGDHAGTVFCHPEARSIGQMIAAVMLIYDCLIPDDMRNHVEFL